MMKSDPVENDAPSTTVQKPPASQPFHALAASIPPPAPAPATPAPQPSQPAPATQPAQPQSDAASPSPYTAPPPSATPGATGPTKVTPGTITPSTGAPVMGTAIQRPKATPPPSQAPQDSTPSQYTAPPPSAPPGATGPTKVTPGTITPIGSPAMTTTHGPGGQAAGTVNTKGVTQPTAPTPGAKQPAISARSPSQTLATSLTTNGVTPNPSDPKSTPNGTDGGVNIPTPVNHVDVPSPSYSIGAGDAVQSQGHGTGFANLQSLLMANRDSAQGMAQGLVDKAYGQGRDAGTDQGKAKTASDYANSLGTPAGIQADLMQQYGKDAYNQGQAGFDTLLAGAAGSNQFNQAKQAYGGLYQSLLNQPAAPVVSNAGTGIEKKQEQREQAAEDSGQTPAQADSTVKTEGYTQKAYDPVNDGIGNQKENDPRQRERNQTQPFSGLGLY